MSTPGNLSEIITAYDLLDGYVVFLTEELIWSSERRDAVIAEEAVRAEQLLNIAHSQPELVVDAYRIEVRIDEQGVPQALQMREIARLAEPLEAGSLQATLRSGSPLQSGRRSRNSTPTAPV